MIRKENIYARRLPSGDVMVALSNTSLTYQLFEYGVITEVPAVCNDGHFVPAQNLERIDTTIYNILYL